MGLVGLSRMSGGMGREGRRIGVALWRWIFFFASVLEVD